MLKEAGDPPWDQHGDSDWNQDTVNGEGENPEPDLKPTPYWLPPTPSSPQALLAESECGLSKKACMGDPQHGHFPRAPRLSLRDPGEDFTDFPNLLQHNTVKCTKFEPVTKEPDNRQGCFLLQVLQ